MRKKFCARICCHRSLYGRLRAPSPVVNGSHLPKLAYAKVSPAKNDS